MTPGDANFWKTKKRAGSIFLSQLRKEIEVATSVCTGHSNMPLAWHRICQGLFPFENVWAVIDRQENVPLTDLGEIVRQSVEDIPKYYPSISVDHYVIMSNHIDYL